MLITTALVAMAACLLVSGPMLSLPLLIGRYTVTPLDIRHRIARSVHRGQRGTAPGLITSRLALPRTGCSVLTTLLLVSVFTLVDGLPPINPVIRLLSNGSGSPAPVSATAAYAGLGLVLSAISTTITHHVATRRNRASGIRLESRDLSRPR